MSYGTPTTVTLTVTEDTRPVVAIALRGPAISDFAEACRAAALAYGFHPNSVDQFLPDVGREWSYLDERDESA